MFAEQQQKILMSNKNEDSGTFSQDAIINAIAQFNYMPEMVVTILSYFCRYKGLYKTDCANWSDHQKIRLLLMKLGAVEQ